MMLIYHKLLEGYLQKVFILSVWKRKLWTFRRRLSEQSSLVAKHF